MQSFLERLAGDDETELRAIGRIQRLPRGAQLLSERQVGDRVMVLLSGRAKVSVATDTGRDVVLGFRGPGDLVGELAALDGLPRSGAVEALEPVELLTVAQGRFRAWIECRPSAAMVLFELLSLRLRDADRKRIEFAVADTVARVASRLVELGERFGEVADDGVIDIDLPLSQDELAGWCSASREATARALQTLRELGWVETGRRRLIVRDVEALRLRAG